MRFNYRKVSAVISCAALSVTILCAGPKGKAKGHHHKDESPEAATRVEVGIFGRSDCDMIRHHYSTYRGNLPPGLAKRGGDLPPGLAKQLRRNGHLPPGLEKKLYPFPVELEHGLPPLRQGLVRGIIGGSAVIYDKHTSVILDIFSVF